MLSVLKKKKRFFIFLAGIVLLVLLGLYHDQRTACGSNDFDTYHFAGRLALSGENLYTHEAFRTTISPFLYLPFFAVLMMPLGLLDIRSAGAVWYALSVLSFAGSLFAAARLASGKAGVVELFRGRPYLFKIASLAVLMAIWLDNVSLAQIDILIFFLVLVSLLAHEKGRKVTSGLVLALAAVIKIYPFYILLYMLVKRRFAAAAAFCAGLFFFLLVVPWAVLGPDNFGRSMRSWLEIRAAPYFQAGGDEAQRNFAKFEAQLKPKNQSLSAVATRFLIRDDEAVTKLKTEDFEYRIYWPHPFSPRQVDVTVKILLFAVLAITFLSLDYRGVFSGRMYLGLEYSVIFLSMLLLFPMVKSHTFAPLIFPLMLLCGMKNERGPGSLYGLRGLDAAFYSALVLYALQGIEYMQVLGAGFFCVLVLWIMFVFMLRKERARGAA